MKFNRRSSLDMQAAILIALSHTKRPLSRHAVMFMLMTNHRVFNKNVIKLAECGMVELSVNKRMSLKPMGWKFLYLYQKLQELVPFRTVR